MSQSAAEVTFPIALQHSQERQKSQMCMWLGAGGG